MDRLTAFHLVVPALLLGVPGPAVHAQALIDPEEAIQGSWIGGGGDEDLEFLVEFEGSTGTLRRLGPGGAELSLVFESDGTGLLWLREARRPSANAARMLLQTPDRALIWDDGEDELGHMWRVVPVPETLLGEWVVVEPGREPAEARSVVIEAERITMTPAAGAVSRSGEVMGLASTGPTIELAMADVVRAHPRRERVVMRFQPLPDGSFIAFVRSEDRGEFVILHRPGAPPAWR